MNQIDKRRPGSTWAHSLRTYLSAPANVVFVLTAALVVGLHLYVFFTTMFLSPVGFDEAFNLQAPLNLVSGNGYATEDWMNGGPRVVFDPVVSTGPIVEMPAALSFLVFGISIEAARLVMLPYFVLLLACLFVLGRRAAGRWGGVVAVAVALALDSRADFPFTMIFGPSDALGEYASAALIALALVLLPKYRLTAGIVLGFATLAKFITFIAVPAFMIALLLVPAVRGRFAGKPVREILAFAALTVVPSILWELVKLMSLGWTRYLEVLIDYLRFIFRSGSGADGGFRAFFLERLARLFAAWHLPTALVIALAVALFALAIVAILRYWPTGLSSAWTSAPAKSRWHTRLVSVTKQAPLWVWAATGTLAIFALWWSFISSSLFIRHTMPVLLVTIPLVTAFAVKGIALIAARGGRIRVAMTGVAAILVVVTAVQGSMTVASATRYDGWTREQQESAGAFIAELGVDEVQGIGWWAAPALRLIDGVPSTPVGTGTGPLVLEPITELLEPGSYELGLSLCSTILYQQDGFVVCEIPADTQPLEQK